MDERGRRFVLLKRSHETSLVADLATGAQAYRPNTELRDVNESDDAEPDLLGYIASHEPVRVRTLLDVTSLCESDLHGLLRLLEMNDHIEETTVFGERGYEIAVAD